MGLRAMAPWAIAAVATTIAIFALVDQQAETQPAEQPVIEAEAPPTAPPTAPEEQPPENPEPEAAAIPPAEPRVQAERAMPTAAEATEAPAVAARTGLEVTRGGIRMVELTNPRTGERYFRVVNRRRVASPPDDAIELAPEADAGVASGEADAGTLPELSDEEMVELEPPPDAEVAEEAEETPQLTEDDIRRIIREERVAQQQEDELAVQRARDEALAEFRRDAEISPGQAASIRRILDAEMQVIEEIREAVAAGDMNTHWGWMRVDQARRASERNLRDLLGDRAYNLYHQRSLGHALTGMPWMEEGNMQPWTTYWR